MGNHTYTLKRSKRKTLALVIRDNQLEVRAPLVMSIDEIERFIQTKSAWINKHMAQKRIPLTVDLTQNEQLYFGQVYPVVLIEEKGFKYKVEDEIIVYGSKSRLPWLEKKLTQAMELELELYIKERVQNYLVQLMVQCNSISFKNYRASWGKCNTKKDLFFSKKLIFTSYRFIDYVVLHECVHLIHFNHSSAFYETIEKVMPDYRQVIHSNKEMMFTSNDLE